MFAAETRCCRSRAVLTACLSYVLALQLVVAGLTSGVQAQSLGARTLGLHFLCLTGGADRSDSKLAGAHDHDLCCTLACAGVALLAPAPRGGRLCGGPHHRCSLDGRLRRAVRE